MEDCAPEQADNTVNNGRDEKGRFTFGNAGRPPMATNKVAARIREIFGDFLLRKLPDLDSVYDQLTPKEKARLFVELKSFWVPKQKEITIEQQGPEIAWDKLSEATLKELIDNSYGTQ